MAKTRIQVIGDSLSLHRDAEGVKREDTYPFILSKKYAVYTSSGYGKSTNDDFHITYGTKFVVVHLGLVDCFPRLYSNATKELLHHFPIKVVKIITYVFSHYRFYFTRMFPKVKTQKSSFESNMTNIIKKIKDMGAIPVIIDIVRVSNEAAMRNYGANENIDKYNDILRKLSFQYDCERIRLHYMTKHHPEMLHTDGQHLSKIGHRVLSKLIDDTIEGTRW